MEESAYRSGLPDLQSRLAAVGVRAVYEDRLPPELNAALQLGCVAVVSSAARRRNLGAGFDLSELQMKPVAQVGSLCGVLVGCCMGGWVACLCGWAAV
jgi:DNA polymerase epsilon subunit 1